MRVNNIQNYGFFSTKNHISKNFFSYIKSDDNSFDTVSFQSKRKPSASKTPAGIKEGLALGKRIYSSLSDDPSKQKALDIMKQIDPSLEIKDISQLKSEVHNYTDYGAYLRSDLKPDFTCQNAGLFINLAPLQKGDKQGALKFAMELAHEYTHARQNANGESSRYIKIASHEDFEYAEFLSAFGTTVFQPFDGELQARFVSCIIEAEDIPVMQRYNMINPRKTPVSKSRMLKHQNMKSEDEFRQLMNSLIKQKFKDVVDFISKNKNSIDPRMRDYIERSGITKEENLDKLFKDTRKYCKYLAVKEAEAYKTEAEVAKNILNLKGDITNDIFPLYYKMLSDAFN